MRYQVQDIDGKLLDAHFDLDNSCIDYHARGGSKKSGTQINSDYGPGLRLIFNRLSTSNIPISGVWVNSSTAQGIPKEERCILSGEEFEQQSPESAVRILSKRMKRVGQLGKPRGGNSTKKITIEFRERILEAEIRKTALLLTSTSKEYHPGTLPPKSLKGISKSRNKNFDDHYQKLRLEEMESTDRYLSHVRSRKEQARLRALIFKGDFKFQCAICHRIVPTDLMVAAHIKPRSKCSKRERTDPYIVMPVCKVGCDDFFEKNYLIVDSAGSIQVNSKKKFSPDLHEILNGIAGKQCTSFNCHTEKYFKYKRDFAE